MIHRAALAAKQQERAPTPEERALDAAVGETATPVLGKKDIVTRASSGHTGAAVTAQTLNPGRVTTGVGP